MQKFQLLCVMCKRRYNFTEVTYFVISRLTKRIVKNNCSIVFEVKSGTGTKLNEKFLPVFDIMIIPLEVILKVNRRWTDYYFMHASIPYQNMSVNFFLLILSLKRHFVKAIIELMSIYLITTLSSGLRL